MHGIRNAVMSTKISERIAFTLATSEMRYHMYVTMFLSCLVALIRPATFGPPSFGS